VDSLLKTGKHVVTAITRKESTSSIPDGVKVVKVDYDDHSSLVGALRGQDALLITMSVKAPADQQEKLIRAAADANVPWIFPNEWGVDSTNDQMNKDIGFYEAKLKPPRLVEALGKGSWIGVVTGFWYEWSLSIVDAYGFDFKERKVTFFDDGETIFNTSTWPQVGRTVAAILSLPVHKNEQDPGPCLDQLKNDYVYASSFTISQKDMFASAMRVTQTKADDWTIAYEPAEDRYRAGRQAMLTGDRRGFGRMLYSRVFYKDDSGYFEKSKGLHNKLLGLPNEDLDEATKRAIQRQEEGLPW